MDVSCASDAEASPAKRFSSANASISVSTTASACGACRRTVIRLITGASASAKKSASTNGIMIGASQ